MLTRFAKKEINLIPIEFKTIDRNTAVIASVSITVVVMAVYLLFFYVLPKTEIARLTKESSELKTRVDAMNIYADMYKKVKEKKDDLAAKQKTVSAIDAEKIEVTKLIEKIVSVLPEGVKIASLSIDDGSNIKVSFLSSGTIDTVRLVVKLKSLNMFEGIELDKYELTGAESLVSFNLVKIDPNKKDSKSKKDASKSSKTKATPSPKPEN